MTYIFQKFFVQIAGLLHDVLDKFSDAGRTARHGIRELQKQIGQAEESVSDVQAELMLMKNESTKATGKAEKWGRVAEAAAEAGDKLAAIEAVQHQVQAEEMALNFGRNVDRLSPMLDQLKVRLSDLRQKQIDMQHRATMIDARSKVADAEARAARSLGNVGNKPGIDFELLESQVDRKEAKAASLANMAHAKSALDVDKRLAQHGRRDAISAKLQQLGITPTVDNRAIAEEGGGHA